ncbi:MAG: helix-turn-helix domain-containing protein [Thermoproteales archaeon]|nr:helix-turn-helix domain-containing protein [Thermoproteales archaeon]
MRNEIIRPIIISVFASLYELERKMISERTKAGLERARRMGKKIGGKQKLSNKQVKEMIKAYREGIPIAKLARRYGVSRSTVYRYLKKNRVNQPK